MASFVFPILASYRALEHNDPTLIRVWLIYWVVIALQITVESYTEVFLRNLPLFNLVKFFFTLWLVLPQFQGASQIYALYVRPFLSSHEQDIDRLVTEAYDKIKILGGEYVAKMIELVQRQIASALGFNTHDTKSANEPDHVDTNSSSNSADQGTSHSQSTSTEGNLSYADKLFSKFKTPPSLTLPDSYSLGTLLSPLAPRSTASYLASLMGSSSQAGGVSLPSSLRTKADRLAYIEDQKLKLKDLISSLDEHTKAIENEDEPNDIDYDVVKKDEAEESSYGDERKGWFFWK